MTSNERRKLEDTIELPMLKIEQTITLPKLKEEVISAYEEIEMPRQKKDMAYTLEIDATTSPTERKKITLKRIIPITIISTFFITLTISVFNIALWSNDTLAISSEISKINETVNIKETADSDNVEIIQGSIPKNKSNPYFNYINMNLIDVNFKTLLNINSETKGWLKVNGTNINYPFVQGKDNEYYLKHSFDKSKNEAGWIFLDYRNNLESEEKNSIIYAHSRLDKTMFGSLKNVLSSKWIKNKDNHVILISTEYENTLWQVFSVYYTPTTTDYLKTKFTSDKEFTDFANMLIKRSAHDFEVEVSENDRILTLSTCHNSNEKTVLHAKLIKREKK